MFFLFSVIAIIATSKGRTRSLLEQAIPSVLTQSYPPYMCIVVDDNDDSSEYKKITIALQEIQKETSIKLRVMRNNRTHGFSGTGAWNTALDYIRQYTTEQNLGDIYIAILDDDDIWHSTHLALCAQKMSNNPDAIFCNLTRVYQQYKDPGTLHSYEDLTIPKFLYGNPGVQGSNMCFRFEAIDSIGGFDETLKSCTDRDLMIRFLEKFGNSNIDIIEEQTVWHDARSPDCVTNNLENKASGLDSFYQKHLHRFDEETLKHSLLRAERLFSYQNAKKVWKQYYQQQEIIAIVMPLFNGAKSIQKSIHSVVTQNKTSRPIVLFIGNDGSTDNWESEIANYLDNYHNIIVTNISGGSPAKARNALTQYILHFYPNTYILCRLDADDELCSTTTLSEIEQLFEDDKVQVVLCSNYQIQGHYIVGENRANDDFHNNQYMSRRLLAMASGNFEAELPSCNLCLRPSAYLPYPDESSGEDHWLVIQTLLQFPKQAFLMVPQQMYCRYNIDGNTTQKNKTNTTYINSRRRLYEYYIRNINR